MIASESEVYGVWVVIDTSESKELFTRDSYSLGIGPTGGPEVLTYHTCYIKDRILQSHVSSPIKFHRHSFEIMQSRDQSYSLDGEPCTAVLRKGKYPYRVSKDGEFVIVGKGKSAAHWRRPSLSREIRISGLYKVRMPDFTNGRRPYGKEQREKYQLRPA